MAVQAGEQLDTSLGRASYQYLVLVEPGRETGRTWALGSRERVVGSLERVSFLGLTGRRARETPVMVRELLRLQT